MPWTAPSPSISRSSISWRSSPRTTGWSAWRGRWQKPLTGLKVACYYGCLLTRPPEVPNLDCAEAPTIMERVIGAAGAETVAWSHRLECCGANFTLSRPGVVLQALRARSWPPPRPPAPTASWSPAPCATATWTSGRKRSKRHTGEQFGMPVFYMTQLLALAAGVPPSKLGFDSMIVSPLPLLKGKELALTPLGRA